MGVFLELNSPTFNHTPSEPFKPPNEGELVGRTLSQNKTRPRHGNPLRQANLGLICEGHKTVKGMVRIFVDTGDRTRRVDARREGVK